MYLLFTSNARDRYLQDALDSTALPSGQVIRYRYDFTHVDAYIKKMEATSDGKVEFTATESNKALLIYAERVWQIDVYDYRFYPIRFGTIRAVTRIGDASYVDIVLTGYPEYDRDENSSVTNPNQFQELISSIQFRPVPKQEKGQTGLHLSWNDKGELIKQDQESKQNCGYFIRHLPDGATSRLMREASPSDLKQQKLWEAVVEVLGATTEFHSCTFFRLLFTNNETPTFSDKMEPVYRLVAGRHSTMSCRVWRPLSGNSEITTRTILLDQKGDALYGIWPENFLVDSRYNEQRLTLSTKRILDNATATLTVQVEESPVKPDRVIAPITRFYFLVEAPKAVIGSILFCFFVSALLLSIGPDFITKLIDALSSTKIDSDTFPKTWALEISTFCKTAGGLAAVLGAYLGLRKLPLKS